MSKENNTKLSTTTNNNSEYQNNSKKHRKLIRTTNNNNNNNNSTSNNNNCDSVLNNQIASPPSSCKQSIASSVSINQSPTQQNLISSTQSIVQTALIGSNNDAENNSSSGSGCGSGSIIQAIELNRYPSFSIRCSSIDQQQEDAVVVEILASRQHTTTPTSTTPSPKQSQPPPFPPPILQTSSILTSSPSPSSLIQTNLILTNQMDQYKSNKSTTDKATSPIIPNSPSLSSVSSSFLHDSIGLGNLIKLQQQQYQPTTPTNQSSQQQQQHHHHYHQTTKIINYLNPDSLQSHSTPSSLNSSNVNLHEPITTTATTTTLNNNNNSSSSNISNNLRNISNQMLSTSLSSSTININHLQQQPEQHISDVGINKSVILKQQTATSTSSGTSGAPSSNSNKTKKSITNPFFCDKFKRDEFLKATMRICLVVSPPTSKLQSKSKSLTHLDQLDQNIEIQNDQTLVEDIQPHPPTSLVEIKHLDVQQNNLSNHYNSNCSKSIHKMCWLATTISTTTTITSNLITPTTLPSPIFPTSSLSPSISSTTQPVAATTPTKTNPTPSAVATAANTIITVSPNCNTTINNVSSTNTTTISSSSSLSNTTTNTITSTSIASPVTNTTTSTSSASSYIKKKSSSFLHRNYTSSSTKKPMLSRSEVSSSEYFTVLFNLDNDHNDDRKELIIPSTKGVTLANALASALNMRNLSFSQIQISDNNFQSSSEIGSYTGVVDEHTDIGMLSGKMLIVTEKENSLLKRSHSMLKKAASIGHSKTQKLFSSASTEETLADTDQTLKLSSQSLKHSQQQTPQTSKRWSFLGVKSPQQSQLCDLLNKYAKNGVPKSNISQLSVSPAYAEAVSYLEIVLNSTWINFVDRADMTDQEMKIQSAIWELVSTEADYIRALQTVSNLFLACLEGVQSENLLTDIDQNKLFSNIREICDVNIKFWSMYLYPMVKQSELTHTQLVIDYFQDGFLSFAKLFEPYTKYCAEQSTCQNTCKELNNSNLLFTTYLAWCESRSECKRLRLADILVRPMQRMTKYSLLLVAIRKHLASDEAGCEIMDSMIHTVEDFVCSVNSHLTTRQENERLKGIMARIEVYDVVDSINEHLDKMVKQYTQMFDLCEPMKGCSVAQSRHLFMEGDLKFKDHISKADVHCFLLTDILLICKPITKRGQGALKIIRQPFMTDKLVIQLKDNVIYCVYLNDFNSAIAGFSLQSSESKVIKNWHDSITKAKHIYTRIKQGSHWDEYNFRSYGGISGGGSISGGLSSGIEAVSNSNLRKSPHSSSFGSKVPSSNNSVSGSVELNESVSKNISVDYEKANSLSSDEGAGTGFYCTNDITIQNQQANKQRSPQNSFRKIKIQSANSLIVQPSSNLGQSLPNLTLNSSQNSINNQLLVPGVNGGVTIVSKSQQSSSNHLLSPSHRGISYPPPSPPRGTLQRSTRISSVKNPPLMKTKNVTSQSSFNWTQSQTDNTNVLNLSRNQTSDPNIHLHHHHHQLQQQQSSPTISSSSPTSSSSNQTPQQSQQQQQQPQLPYVGQESDV